MKLRYTLLAFAAGFALMTGQAAAVDLAIVSGAVGNDLQTLRHQLDEFEKATGNKVSVVSMPSSTTDQFGQYRLWLAAQNPDIDVYRTDVIWAPQLASQFVDLTDATKDVIGELLPVDHRVADRQRQARRAAAISPTPRRSTTARTCSTSTAPASPKTWQEMADTAKMIMDKERAAGNKDMWGFVFQGNAYEGLTCDALEWVKSNGGGQIVEPDGIDLDQQSEGGRGHRDGQGLGRHDLAARRSRLQGRGGPRRLADRQRRLHAQLALRLFARQQRRLADQGQVRRDHAADRPRSGRPLGGDPRRLEPRRVEVLEAPGRGDRSGQVPGFARAAEVSRARGHATCRR